MAKQEAWSPALPLADESGVEKLFRAR